MKQRKLLSALTALLLVAVPAMAVFTGMDLDATLSNLRRELSYDYRQKTQIQKQLQEQYEVQHRQMVEIAKKCNDLSLMLYSQKQEYTFDVSYALEKVTQEYENFNKNRTPYDLVVGNLDIDINRYARLIESLRRLPPELEDLDVVPDSLAYHNDTLDAHLLHNASLLQQELEEKVDAITAMTQVQDTSATEEAVPAFILSEQGQRDRDTCLFYASELLKMYAASREMAMADSTHYQEARLRLEESYKYAREYYDIIENKVFVEGQIPWTTILTHPGRYWREARQAVGEKYRLSLVWKALYSDKVDYSDKQIANDNMLSNSARVYWWVIYILAFFILWGLSALILWPLYRFIKPLGNWIQKEQKPYIALLLACVLFLILSYESNLDDIARKALSIIQTFLGLLIAINTALLIRLNPSKLRDGVRMYMPTIITALIVISCRVLFVPNAFLNFVFPPLLLAMAVWQLTVNLRHGPKADTTDTVVGWVSFGITAIATVVGWAGYIFLALIILAWWYVQLAIILGIATIWDLTFLYKEKRLDKRVETYKARLTYVPEQAKDKLLFGATWFYDLIREVLIPMLVLGTIPTCVYWALDIFEFRDLYIQIFMEPFFSPGGGEGIRISLYSVLLLTFLFFMFRYVNKAAHTIFRTLKYRNFLRKNKRPVVRNDEINLSLGDSLINVTVWFIYAYWVIIKLNIPTGSLGLIAGGLSAGIGLALKDIINNFIYGIQLMGGRLKVGDWIECDGIRGRVADINYQTTLVDALGGSQVAFLNTSLFNKSFKNLTRNGDYEYVKVSVGVAYGTDFEKLKELLVKELEVLKTKDAYGRDVVDPDGGIRVGLDDFGDNAVNIGIKQSVLVTERFRYTARLKVLIYKIFNENNITIPFPQRDIHIINEKD